MPSGSGDSAYHMVVYDHVFPQIQEFRPDIIFIAAGFDAMDGDGYANQKLTANWYGWCVAELMSMDIPIVLNLEGGYNPENVAEGVDKVVDALGGLLPNSFIPFMRLEPLTRDVKQFIKRVCDVRAEKLKELTQS